MHTCRLPILLLAAAGLVALPLLARADSAASPCTREGFAADPPLFRSCTDCHTGFAPNQGDGSFELTGVPLTWTAGSTYRITAFLGDPGQQRWGFRIAVVDPAGADAGVLTPADGNTEPCFFSGRSYLRQSGPGSRPGVPDGPVDFAFDWTAPAAGTGAAVFYAVGLSCDWNSSPAGDVTYTAAAAVLEDAAPGAGISLVLQPDTGAPPVGSDFTVRARLGNHTAAPQSAFLVTRLRLPNGQPYPPAGWLAGPTAVSLAPGERLDLDLIHPVPVSAPLLTPRYEAFLGTAPATALASDAFDFKLRP